MDRNHSPELHRGPSACAWRAALWAFAAISFAFWIGSNWHRIRHEYEYGTLESRSWQWRLDEGITCVIWACAGVLVLIQERCRHNRWRPARLAAAAAMMLLSLSSIVQMKTQTLWWPWWLFLWNWCCVLTILVAADAELRMERRHKEGPEKGVCAK